MPHRKNLSVRTMRSVVGDKEFDSRSEAKRYLELLEMESKGEITNLECQVKYLLTPSMKRDDGTTERASEYICDFKYDLEGISVVEDVKSAYTARIPSYVLKRKMMLFIHGITIKEVIESKTNELLLKKKKKAHREIERAIKKLIALSVPMEE